MRRRVLSPFLAFEREQRDLALPGHGEASIVFHLNFEGFRQQAGAVVSTNRIADLNDLLRREKPTEFGEGRIINVAAIGHLLDVAEQGPLLVIEQHRPPPVRHFSHIEWANRASAL